VGGGLVHKQDHSKCELTLSKDRMWINYVYVQSKVLALQATRNAPLDGLHFVGIPRVMFAGCVTSQTAILKQ
jgi:hypothetical protein